MPMSHLAEVMFIKAFVVAAWVGVYDLWTRGKERFRANGLELRFDKMRGVYVPFDPFEKVERFIASAGRKVEVCFLVFTALLLGGLAYAKYG